MTVMRWTVGHVKDGYSEFSLFFSYPLCPHDDDRSTSNLQATSLFHSKLVRPPPINDTSVLDAGHPHGFALR